MSKGSSKTWTVEAANSRLEIHVDVSTRLVYLETTGTGTQSIVLDPDSDSHRWTSAGWTPLEFCRFMVNAYTAFAEHFEGQEGIS